MADCRQQEKKCAFLRAASFCGFNLAGTSMSKAEPDMEMSRCGVQEDPNQAINSKDSEEGLMQLNLILWCLLRVI